MTTRQHLYYSGMSLCGMLLTALLVIQPAMAQDKVYKSVDENGNVVFSDQPPTPDAEPFEVPEANVITTVKATPRPVRPAGSDTGEGVDASLDFISPQPEETFWGTAGSLAVALQADPPMRAGMQVAIYIDDVKVSEISGLQTTIQSIDRGTHSIRVELLGRNGQSIATAGPRTFFMKQNSQLFNNNNNNSNNNGNNNNNGNGNGNGTP